MLYYFTLYLISAPHFAIQRKLTRLSFSFLFSFFFFVLLLQFFRSFIIAIILIYIRIISL